MTRKPIYNEVERCLPPLPPLQVASSDWTQQAVSISPATLKRYGYGFFKERKNLSLKSCYKLSRLLLCFGIIIALLSSSVPMIWAAPDSTSLINKTDTEDSKKVQNDMGPKVTLVKEGLPQSTVILSVYATELEKQAAQELTSYIKQISGADLPVTGDPAGLQGTNIYIGSTSPNSETDAILAGGDEPDSFRLHVAEGAIQLVGLSDKGVLYAVYELLEQIGVRWFMPGDIGTVVPSMDTIEINYQDTIQHAGFASRFLQAVVPYHNVAGLPQGVNLTEAAPWVQHVRLNQVTYGAHGLLIKSPTNKERPDLFLPDANGKPTTQYDVTQPDVLKFVVEEAIKRLQQNPDLKYLSMGPNDGLVLVLKPNPDWDGNDMDATHGTLSLTDRYVKFFNLVLERLDAAGYSDVKIAFYAYDTYYNPPVRWKPDPRIVPVIASITLDRMHGIGNPLSWERNHMKDIIEGWKAVGTHPTIYEYLYNLADPGLPFSIADIVASEFKYFKDNGVEGIRGEALPAWGYNGFGLYLAAKMMWNPDLDVEALRNDYFTKFYGPAAEPMREHFEILENAFSNADYFAGSTHDFPHILTDNVMKEMEKSLRKAENEAQKVSDPVYAKRVNMVRVAYGFGDSFLEMIDLINNFKFVEAKEKFDQIRKFREEAVLHSPIILSTYGSYLFTNIFFEKIVKEGKQRLSNGNRIVAELPDEWNVMLFPNASGADLGFWKPGLGTESWMKLKTYSESWSDQGLRYYKGHAWYRTMVDVEEKFNNGNPIRLWFSNIDETARVWMNGQELPLLKKGGISNPWEFDATNAIKFGVSNLIVVDVGNEILDELGTGGIVGPAMLWEVVSEPDAAAPTVPTGLSGTAVSVSEIKLSWTASTDNVGVAGYNVYRDGFFVGTTTSTAFTDTGLKSGTTYKYTVKAFDSDENISKDSVKAEVTTKFEGIILQDDFEDGNADGWTYVANAWSVVSDEDNMVLRRTAEPGIAAAIAGHKDWENYSLETTIKPLTLTPISTIQVHVRYNASAGYYSFNYRHSTGKMEFIKFAGGVPSVVEKVDFPMLTNREYAFKVVVNGSTIELYIDGVKIMSVTDSTYTKGKINIQPANSIIQFDNVLVTAF